MLSDRFFRQRAKAIFPAVWRKFKTQCQIYKYIYIYKMFPGKKKNCLPVVCSYRSTVIAKKWLFMITFKAIKENKSSLALCHKHQNESCILSFILNLLSFHFSWVFSLSFSFATSVRLTKLWKQNSWKRKWKKEKPWNTVSSCSKTDNIDSINQVINS